MLNVGKVGGPAGVETVCVLIRLGILIPTVCQLHPFAGSIKYKVHVHVP